MGALTSLAMRNNEIIAIMGSNLSDELKACTISNIHEADPALPHYDISKKGNDD
jgi:hypothetical protein